LIIVCATRKETPFMETNKKPYLEPTLEKREPITSVTEGLVPVSVLP